MADFQLPPWLTPPPPSQIIAQSAAAGAEVFRNLNQRRQLDLETERLRQNSQLQEEALKDKRDLAAIKAKESAIRLGGMTELTQAVKLREEQDLANGLTPDREKILREVFPSFVHKITYNDPDALQRYVTGGASQELRRELGSDIDSRLRFFKEQDIERFKGVEAGLNKRFEEGESGRNKRAEEALELSKKKLGSEEERAKLKTRADSMGKDIESLRKRIKDKQIIKFVGSEEEQARAVREIAELEAQMKDLETQKVNLLKGSSPASSTDNDPLGLFK